MSVYGWLGAGQPSSSLVMGMDVVKTAEIGLLDQIPGLPRGCISDSTSVAILREFMEGQSGLPPR